MKDLISIIIPVYNCEKYLSKCLDSILSQTYKNIEIILVNDGSTDNSIELCNKYKNKDSRVKVFEKENSGPSLTRRYGYEKSSSKSSYIMFIDSDDWMDNDMCEYLINLQKKVDADVVCCGYYLNNDSKEKEERLTELDGKNIIKDYLYNSNIKGCCWNKLYKKNTIKPEYFSSNLKHGEDVLFVCNVLLECNKVVCTNIPKYHYNVSNNSITRSKVNHKKIEDNYNAHKKQIELIKNKFEENFELQSKSIEKLFDSLLLLYTEIMQEKDSNENEKYLVSLIAKSYQEFGKNINIAKSKKIKLFLISKFNYIMKLIYKLKNDKFLLLIYLIIFISIISFILFPILFKKSNQHNIDIITNEVAIFVNSDPKKTDDLEKLGYKILSFSKLSNDTELVVFKDGYCATKIFDNNSISVFPTAESNCYIDNSPEIKFYNGNEITIDNIENPKVRNYIIYGKLDQKQVISGTILSKENIGETNNISITINNEYNKEIFEINLEGYDSLKEIGEVADYIDYNEQMIIRKIGTLTLTGNEQIIYLSEYSTDYNLFAIKSNLLDKEIYVWLEKDKYKDANSIYNAITNAQNSNKVLKVYYILDEIVKEKIALPKLNLNITGNNFSMSSDNIISILLYSQK